MSTGQGRRRFAAAGRWGRLAASAQGALGPSRNAPRFGSRFTQALLRSQAASGSLRRACRLLACLAIVVLSAAYAFSQTDEGDLLRPDVWQAMPQWVGSAHPADDAGIQPLPGGGLRFWVRNGRMKWMCALRPAADADFNPWLVLKYRCVNYDDNVDYMLWLKPGEGPHTKDGLYLLTRGKFRADGKWHTLAVDLGTYAVLSVQQIAVQARSRGNTVGALEISRLTFAASPPEGAEILAGSTRRGKLAEVRPGPASQWRAELGWLANPDASARAENTVSGVRFIVPRAGRGMKWSRNLEKPLPAGYYVMRYRAHGIRPVGDYALYAANQPGGKAPSEQYVFRLQEIIDDGQWHVAVGWCTVKSAVTLAVQVQAAEDGAWLEISRLEVWGSRPTATFRDLCQWMRGWPTISPQFKPIELRATASPAQIGTLLGLSGWLDEKITVDGVPFLVSKRGGLATGARQRGEISVDVPAGRWREAYLLLAARLPKVDAPSYPVGHKPWRVAYPHRFICRLEYADGRWEQQIPVRLSSGRAEVTAGIGAYGLAVLPGRRLRKIVLVDGHDRGAFALLAATLSTRAGQATAVLKPVRNPALSPRRRPDSRRQIRGDGGNLYIDSGALHLRLRTRPGLELISLRSDYLRDPIKTAAWSGPIFEIRAGDITLRSTDARVTSVDIAKGKAAIGIDLRPSLPGTAQLEVAAWRPDEVRLSLTIQLARRPEGNIAVRFPVLSGCRATSDFSRTWVFYPRRGAVITNKPMGFTTTYSGIFPLQVMGFYDERGGGIYLRTEYSQRIVDRQYSARRTAAGIHLAIIYPWWRGERINAIIGTNPDDWHGQLDAYNRWRATWFRPRAPRKDWFRRVFNFRQQFLSFAVPRRSGMFDPETKTFRILEVLKRDAELFGGVDYLHLFDWGWSPSTGRCGDYEPWDYLGPPEKFAQAIAEVQRQGIPVGLYIEGRLVSPKSRLFKTAQPWQILRADGTPVQPFAPDISICPWVKAWQDHLAQVYARVRRQTGAMGYYIDEFGFAALTCYASNHGHPVPAAIAGGELELTRRVRAALGPDCAIYTEESPPDITMQWQDGSFTYAISSVSDDLSPHHLNLTRFAVPDFKTIEIITCDRPLGENIEALRRILFNGEAIWLEGIAEDWFDQRALDFIRRMHKILRGNADCFASEQVHALVPTFWRGLYANMFEGEGKRIWTVYWTGPRTLTGPWLSAPAERGAEYAELWAGRKLSISRGRRRDVVGGTIHPHEVLVVVQRYRR